MSVRLAAFTLVAAMAAATAHALAYPQITVPVAVPEAAPSLQPNAPVTAWNRSAAVSLRWDVGHARAADDATTVHIATDGKFLYIRFDAQQREPLMAAQHSDDTVVGGSNINGGIAWTDDAVWVDLWPTGPAGFQYQFEANPNGAHNEASSENTAFAPAWQSHGAATAGGYVVTMAIPLAVIHGAHAGTWRVQFVRYVRSTGAMNVWSYDSAQTNPDDPARAGKVTIPLVAKPPLPKPRVGMYALGELASAPAGGNTSRVGADFSIPVAQTAAFFGTLHPDYSNVEIDQQSISPTVYPRVYSEVRPFFTQAAPYYNNFNCNVCNGFRTILYTPAIPTPAEGYAFEGREGSLGLAGYDAIGDGRDDSAAALDYTSDDNRWNASLQQVMAHIAGVPGVSGVSDVADEAGVSWFNGKYLSAYANYATDRGTNVPNPGEGNWLDAGGGFISQQYALFGSFRDVGTEFNPVDGFDSHPGILGYGLYGARVWTMSPNDFLSSVGVSGFLDRYQGQTYGEAQSDNQVLVDLLTKGTIDLQLYSGSDYWRFGSALTPISQSAGVSITYHSGMQNNLNNFPTHGSSATPTSIQWYTGNYGIGGHLDTWFRYSTIRVGNRGSLTLTLDDTAQYFHSSPPNIQWFDGIAYAYQVSPNSSFAIGVRRVIGYPPQPNGGGDCEGACSNISVAYHLRLRTSELYVAYGDPNTLTTVPQMIFKLIFYAGGQKGT
jgi:hypothetical protein